MTNYEIIDTETSKFIGILQYYEKERSWIVELSEDLDRWTAPLLFTALVEKGIYTIPRELSRTWVRSRLIPPDRQNIGSILRNHRLKEYDEMKLLVLSEGRCSMDSLMIKKTDALPAFVTERVKKNLIDCVLTGNLTMLLFFRNGAIKKISLETVADLEGVDKILANDALYRTGKVGTGGYSVVFNDSIDLPASVLYHKGTLIPLKQEDFLAFVRENVIDTTTCCELLECSRQNVAYMAKQGQLTPVKEFSNGNLYLKGDILANKW